MTTKTSREKRRVDNWIGSHSHRGSSSLWSDKSFLLGNHLQNIIAVSTRLSRSMPVTLAQGFALFS